MLLYLWGLDLNYTVTLSCAELLPFIKTKTEKKQNKNTHKKKQPSLWNPQFCAAFIAHFFLLWFISKNKQEQLE